MPLSAIALHKGEEKKQFNRKRGQASDGMRLFVVSRSFDRIDKFVSKQITHNGEVRSIDPGVVHVAIVASSACHTCRARHACGMSEQTEKIVDVATPDWASFAVGERVVVAEEQSMGVKAVLLAYVGAFCVLVTVLFATLALGAGEGWAALASLLGVGLYYGVLYGLRHRIENTIHFTITKS